ncbi:hypothetical protein OXX59_002689 [Metschnikowia pulcherrima]
MFKKIFHATAVGKTGDSRPSSTSDSSFSGESEIITASDLAKPEKRFFLRRPSRIKPVSSEHQVSYFRTFDPFDIKSSLKRSSSFPFKSKLDEVENTTLKLPRSKSVHFAENLTTYHEFKPDFNQDSLESTFEEFKRLRQNEAAGETQSEESEDRAEEERDCEEREEAEAEGEEKVQAEKDKVKAEEVKKAAGAKKTGKKKNLTNSNTEANSGMTLARKQLQSVFNGTASNEALAEVSKALGFDTSDSTDVESVSDGKKDNILYDIYEQLCDLRQLKADDITFCTPQSLKRDIMCGLADVGDIICDNRDQLEQSNAEVRNLRHALQQASLESEAQTARMNNLFTRHKDSQNVVKEKQDAIVAISTKLAESEAERTKELKGYERQVQTIQSELKEKLVGFSTEIGDLRKKLSDFKSLQGIEKFSKHEKEELLAKLSRARKEAHDIEAFQEAERRELQEEYKTQGMHLEQSEQESKDKSLCIQNIEAALKAQHAINERQRNEATLMVQEAGKRLEEKKSQISRITKCLESICNYYSNGSNSRPQSEANTRKPSLADPQSPSSNSEQEAIVFINCIQRNISNMQSREMARVKQLENLAVSNKIALDNLALLTKGSFDALAPIFHKECAEHFQQLFSNFTKCEILSAQDQGMIMSLGLFIINSQRELLKQHHKNEQMLETEIQDRLKYQQQVLDSFTRIVGQVMDTNKGTRISGIRGHSSPKKSKTLTRTRHA